MKNFDQIYEEIKSENNNELNNLWKEAKNKSEKANKTSLLICLIIDILAVIIFFNIETKVNSIFAIIPLLLLVLVTNLFVYVIVNIIFSGKETIKYHQKYKSVVINKLMNNFYDNLEYFPNKEMPEYIYEEQDYESYDIYESDDYMEGQINNKYSIQMAEVETKKEEEYENSEGETDTREITLFHGLFAKIEMDKSINSELQIMQNGTFRFDKKSLEMDSSEFEKYFDVKASNQIIGMQLLTADVMQELVDFINKTNIMFDVYIKKNELYLRFYCEDMFEPTNLKKGPLDKKSIEKYFYILNFTYTLSNKLINIVNETEI